MSFVVRRSYFAVPCSPCLILLVRSQGKPRGDAVLSEQRAVEGLGRRIRDELPSSSSPGAPIGCPMPSPDTCGTTGAYRALRGGLSRAAVWGVSYGSRLADSPSSPLPPPPMNNASVSVERVLVRWRMTRALRECNRHDPDNVMVVVRGPTPNESESMFTLG